jgi:hypothetical protein
MSGEIKGAIETAASHPKTSLVITAAFTSNAWLDYGLPIVQGITSIFGMIVVIALSCNHILDFIDKWKKRNKS